MKELGRDPAFDTLLDLHGQTFFVDEIGHWVKFVVARTVKPYEYMDAATLLRDFWNEVDAVLRERGSIP